MIKKKRNAILFSQLEEYKRLFELLTQQDRIDNNNRMRDGESRNASVRKSVEVDASEQGVDLDKLDITSVNVERQKRALENFNNLLEKEKKRYLKLKRHLDYELLNQSPLEGEVKRIVREFIKSIHMKRNTDLSSQIRSIGMKKERVSGETKYDYEFYRIGLTADERKQMVEHILYNEKVSEYLSEKLDMNQKIKELPEFDVEH